MGGGGRVEIFAPVAASVEVSEKSIVDAGTTDMKIMPSNDDE